MDWKGIVIHELVIWNVYIRWVIILIIGYKSVQGKWADEYTKHRVRHNKLGCVMQVYSLHVQPSYICK